MILSGKYGVISNVTIPTDEQDYQRQPYAMLPDDLSSCALVTIDVINAYFNPRSYRGTEHTDAVARSIKTILDAVRKSEAATIPVLYEYGASEFDTGKDPYLVVPDRSQGDIPVVKVDDSVVQGSNIQEILWQLDVDTIFICGGETSGCVEKSVKDFLKNDFRVIVIEGGLSESLNNHANIPAAVQRMVNKGAKVTNKDNLLSHIEYVLGNKLDILAEQTDPYACPQ